MTTTTYPILECVICGEVKEGREVFDCGGQPGHVCFDCQAPEDDEMSTYPSLEQAVEAARQEREHWHQHPFPETVRVTPPGGPSLSAYPCTDSHDPDPHATALKAIAAAYVAVSELPEGTLRNADLIRLGLTYRDVASLAEATP